MAIHVVITAKNGKPAKRIRAKNGKDAALLVKVARDRQLSNAQALS